MAKSHQEDRFAACWRLQSCTDCIYSDFNCGWCPYSSTCIPADSLLDPLSGRDETTCPLSAEKFELRTKALGCGCSTTTFLSVVITILATIAALALLYGLGRALAKLNPLLGSGRFVGTEIEVKDDGTRLESAWWRDTWRGWMYRLWKRPDLNSRSEQEERTERSRLLG